MSNILRPKDSTKRYSINAADKRGKVDFLGQANRWLNAARLSKLQAASDMMVAVSLHFYVQGSKSFEKYMSTGRLCCFPSMERIADDIGVTIRTVRLAMRRLETAGLVQTKQSIGGVGHTNEYSLLPQSAASEPYDEPIGLDDPSDMEPGYGQPRSRDGETQLGEDGTRLSEALEPGYGQPPTPFPKRGSNEDARVREGNAAPLRGAAASPPLLAKKIKRKRLELTLSEKRHLEPDPLEDEGDDDDIYELIKQKRADLSTKEYLALIERNRDSLTSAERRGLSAMAG